MRIEQCLLLCLTLTLGAGEPMLWPAVAKLTVEQQIQFATSYFDEGFQPKILTMRPTGGQRG